MKQEMIQIGSIVNAHGIRGEMRLLPRGFDPQWLTGFKTLYIGREKAPVKPDASHVHKGFVLLKLPGVDDMNVALTYRDKPVYIRREDAHLAPGQFFDEELLDMEVCDADSGQLLGRITAVDDYPAHKLYTVKGEREYLIPAVPGVFIQSVDLAANRMEVHMIKGLATDGN